MWPISVQARHGALPKASQTSYTSKKKYPTTQKRVAPLYCFWRASSKGMPRHAYGRWTLINSWRCYWFHYVHAIVESEGVKNNFAREKTYIQIVFDPAVDFFPRVQISKLLLPYPRESSKVRLVVLKNLKDVTDNWVTTHLTNTETWLNLFPKFSLLLLLLFVQLKCKLVSQTALYARHTKSKGKTETIISAISLCQI